MIWNLCLSEVVKTGNKFDPRKIGMKELYTVDLRKIVAKYGYMATLGDVYYDYRGGRCHMCPNCKGEGEVYERTRKARVYSPWDLDGDSPYYEEINEYEKCPLCEGWGFTKETYKPKMVTIQKQDGWEVEKEQMVCRECIYCEEIDNSGLYICNNENSQNYREYTGLCCEDKCEEGKNIIESILREVD